MGRKGGVAYFEENHQGLQLVDVCGGLEGEGLKDVIPDRISSRALGQPWIP
jgi:hypothetical protein